ncbi:MAG: hypothetical protein DI527_00330 [Chelatococcus sp.]|nr:MAG: hypothetical protein DI527_00330 [Chelatococcus sp.]
MVVFETKRLDIELRDDISKLARRNALEKGLSEAEWSVRRMCAISVATADFQMAYYPDSQPGPAKEEENAEAKTR